VPDEVNGFWSNRSFPNYVDCALSDDFRRGLVVLGLSDETCCAIMCSDAVWWRCHRRIVADYLLLAGRSVFHLMGNDRIEPAKMPPPGRVTGEGLTYPAEPAEAG